MLQRTADILESGSNIKQHNMTHNQQITPAAPPAADHQQSAATVPFWSPQQPFWTPQQRQALAKLFIGGTSSNMNFHPSLINASINGHGQDQNLGPSSNSLHSDQQIRSSLSPYACAANANGYSSAGESQPNSRKSSLDSTASNAQLQQQHFYSSSVNFGQKPMAISAMYSGGQQQPPQSSSSSSLYWPSNDLFAFGLQQMHQLPTAQTPIGVQQLQIALAQQAQHGSLAMGIGQQQQLAPLLPQALLLTQTTKAKLPALRSGHLEMLKWIKDKVQSPIIDFLCEMLADPDQYGHICAFIADREFRINSTKTFTDLLNLRTNQHARSYLKVARAMKSYEERRLNGQVMMRKIADKRNQFKFFPDLP